MGNLKLLSTQAWVGSLYQASPVGVFGKKTSDLRA